MSASDALTTPAWLRDGSLAERIGSGDGTRLADLLEFLGAAVTVRDRDDHFVYANAAAVHSLGFDTLAELQEHTLGAILANYALHDEAGRAVTAADLPSHRLLHGDRAEPLLVHMVDRRSGQSSWRLLRATPLRDEHGTTIATATVIEDVTAVKAAEARLRVLADSSAALADSLDDEQTLRNVASAAVPALADWCLVELLDGSGRREQVAVAHRDPGMSEAAARLGELEPSQPRSRRAASRVAATGESLLFAKVADEHLRRVAHGDEQLEVLRALGVRSAIVVPMRARSETIGSLSFFTSDSGRRLTDADRALAEELARRAGVAIENSRLHTRLSGVAETLARSLLPSPLPDVPGWEIAALYEPAEAGQRIDVGGDFFEVFDAGSTFLALIGDVTGHGVEAATMTALLRHGARFASRHEPEPRAILHRLDEELRERTHSAMCTALCAALHPDRLLVSSAGHPPALALGRDGIVREIPVPGPLLGAFGDSEWHQEPLLASEVALVLLYTDGVTDAAGDHDRFGTARLRRLLADHADASPAELLGALRVTLDRFQPGAPSDDVAALALAPRPGI